jgi:hypothetical protein
MQPLWQAAVRVLLLLYMAVDVQAVLSETRDEHDRYRGKGSALPLKLTSADRHVISL